jgi:hypothetical protein
MFGHMSSSETATNSDLFCLTLCSTHTTCTESGEGQTRKWRGGTYLQRTHDPRNIYRVLPRTKSIQIDGQGLLFLLFTNDILVQE